MSAINPHTSTKSVQEHSQDDKKQDTQMKEEIIRLFLEGNFRVGQYTNRTALGRIFGYGVPQNNAPDADDDGYLSDDSSEDGEDFPDDESLYEEQFSGITPGVAKIMHFTRANGSREREAESLRHPVPYIKEERIMDCDFRHPDLSLVDKLLQINPQLPPFCELKGFSDGINRFVVGALLCNPEQRSRRGDIIKTHLRRMDSSKLFDILTTTNLYNTTPPLHDPEVLRFILNLLSTASPQDSVNTSIDQGQRNEAIPQLPQPLNHMAKLIEESREGQDYAYCMFPRFVNFWIALNTLPLANRNICLQYPALLAQLDEFLCTTIWRRPVMTMKFLIQINLAYSTQQSQDPSWQPLIASRKLDLEGAVEQILCVNRGEGNPLGIIYPPQDNAEAIKFTYSLAFGCLYNKLTNLEPEQKSLLNSTMGDSLRKIDDYISVDLLTDPNNKDRADARDTYEGRPMLSRDGQFEQYHEQAQREYDKTRIIRIFIGGFMAIAWVFVVTQISKKYINDLKISSSLGRVSVSGNSIYKASSK